MGAYRQVHAWPRSARHAAPSRGTSREAVAAPEPAGEGPGPEPAEAGASTARRREVRGAAQPRRRDALHVQQGPPRHRVRDVTAHGSPPDHPPTAIACDLLRRTVSVPARPWKSPSWSRRRHRNRDHGASDGGRGVTGREVGDAGLQGRRGQAGRVEAAAARRAALQDRKQVRHAPVEVCGRRLLWVGTIAGLAVLPREARSASSVTSRRASCRRSRAYVTWRAART
jgi:hypothetical protein